MSAAKLSGCDLYRYELPLSRDLTLKGTVLRHREGLFLRLARTRYEIDRRLLNSIG